MGKKLRPRGGNGYFEVQENFTKGKTGEVANAKNWPERGPTHPKKEGIGREGKNFTPIEKNLSRLF